MKRTIKGIALCALVVLAGCSATEKAEELTHKSYSRFAVGKPYAQVAALPNYESDMLGRVGMFGRPIGSYRLADGGTVHRHLIEQEAVTSEVDLGIVRQSRSVRYQHQLNYFRTDAAGIVTDLARGVVPAGARTCTAQLAGIVRSCEGGQTGGFDLALFDSVVRTASGQPVSVWGPPVDAVAAPVVPAAEQASR